MPKSKLGKWSIALIIAMPILFYIGGSFTNTLYESVSSGRTILEDIKVRPALALTMLTGMISGVSAFVVGLLAILKKKDRGFLVYISTILGFLFTLYLIAEMAFSH